MNDVFLNIFLKNLFFILNQKYSYKRSKEILIKLEI